MKRQVIAGVGALLSALMIAGLMPATAAAGAIPYTQILRIDLTGLPVAGPCWTEQLTIDKGGLVLVQVSSTDGSGNVHATFEATYQGVQATSESGVRYVVVSGTRQTYVVNYDSTLYEINLLNKMRWVAQGPAPDYWTSAWIHTTRTPAGDYAVDEFRFDAVCP
jgi:hypothetical protein